MAKNKVATCLAILLSLTRYPLLILALLLLVGCQKTLVFFEQTAFKLGISVNEEPPVPLEVTVGLKRRVVAISPPKKPLEGGSPVSEAVSLLSRFDVIYLPDEPTGTATSGTTTAGTTSAAAAPTATPSPGNPFGGTLRIISAFASGEAAVTIAGDAVATAAVVEPELLLLGNRITPDVLGPEATRRREAMYDAIEALDDDRARGLASAPPRAIDQALLSELDGDNRRSTNAARARQVLHAWVGFMPLDDYGAWEAALGIP
jgi:hypothetical protein